MTRSVGEGFAWEQLARVEEAPLRWVAPAPVARPLGDHLSLCRAALAAPWGAAPLAELARGRRVTVVVSDASREEPREALLDALLAELEPERTTLIVASGTHAPAPPSVLAPRHRRLRVVVHDATDEAQLVELGRTPEGTRVRLHRAVADAEVVVSTGRLRPHYFAGYSGGVKGVFPGCAAKADVLHNHQLKADPTARLGRVEGNRCRADMEAAAALLPGRLVVLNVLDDCDGQPVAAAYGDAIAAHRALVARADPLFRVRAPRARVIVVADRPPVSTSLYQASKCLPPAGALLEPGGTIILVAECDEGLGPTARVNEGIYELGIRPQLPEAHRVVLVSRRSREEVATSYAQYAADLPSALAEATQRTGAGEALVLWRAGECIAEPVEA